MFVSPCRFYYKPLQRYPEMGYNKNKPRDPKVGTVMLAYVRNGLLSEINRLVRLGWMIVPIGVLLDWAGRLGSNTAHLPFMLDSIGTTFSGAMGGPLIGICTGMLSWVVFAVTGFTHIPIGAGVGVVVMGFLAGWLGQHEWFRDFRRVMAAAFLLALITTVIRVPLNVIWWGGQSGKTLGDAIFLALSNHHMGLWIPAFLGEGTTNLISACVACLLVYFIKLGLIVRVQDAEHKSASD